MPSILDLLVKIELLEERQHDAVLSRSRSPAGGHIVQQVAEMGYATEGTMARAISVELGLPRIDLAMTPPEPAALALLDARTCAELFLLPVALREGGELLWLAMADPTDPEAMDLVRRKTQKRVRPAVAGPSEILRAVRAHYAAGTASTQPQDVQSEKPAAIEIESEEEGTPFEVVNVADDIGSSALSRIAEQLGVEVPPNIPSRGHMDLRAANAPPPKTDTVPPPFTLEELLTPLTRLGPISGDDLRDADMSTLDALRSSMEKGALVLRTLAELCVEKGVITREEFKKRKPATDPIKTS